MKTEEKDLLLKDLCARLPYNPMVEYKGESYDVLGITHGRLALCKPFMSYTLNEHPLVEELKPYLFPLSSMTEEQKEEYNQSRLKDLRMLNSVLMERISDENNFDRLVVAYNEIDWLNKNYFDYRGLIEKSLAIDATNLGIYK